MILKFFSYFSFIYIFLANNIQIFSDIGNKKCCNCCKNDVKNNCKQNDDFKEKTVDDLELDKNIPQDFIDNNKERVFKMIKVYNNDFKNNDIDKILLLLYNLNESNCGIILKYFHKKFVKNENYEILYVFDFNKEMYIFPVNIKNLLNPKDFFISFCCSFGTCYYYCKFSSIKITETGFNLNYKEEIDTTHGYDNIAIKTLFDYFYKCNIEKNKTFPVETIFKIADYLYLSKKKDLEKNLEKYKYFKINFRTKDLDVKNPICFYLNEKLKECYQVKDEKEFKVLKDDEQIIIKISSNEIEFFKS